MTRAVLFDTETTGLEPHLGHRVIEIAALELINDLPTGRHFHALVNPRRDIPEEATRVHGFTAAHLRDKPDFGSVASDLAAFLGDGNLIAHNAPFDFAFLNAEFTRSGLACLDPARMVCTLVLAQTRFPGLPNSLDALCRRFGIDLATRTTHNALLDCKLLAEVYIELTGGRQRGLSLQAERRATRVLNYTSAGARSPRPILPTDSELAAHASFIACLKDAVWLIA